MLWRILVIPVLALALAGAAACGDDDEGGNDDGPTESSVPSASGASAPTGTPVDDPTDAPADATPDAPTEVPTGPATAAPTGAATGAPTATDAPNVETIVLVARDFAFDPLTIEAEAGAAVKIRFTDLGGARHTFTIDELDIDLELNTLEVDTVEFVFPDQPLEFYCRIHPILMGGTLKPGG